MSLQTRKPTGIAAWPLILVEGLDKVGKTTATLNLAADERIGRSFVFDLGEGAADEYALPDYEMVDHDGTYTDIMAKLTAATLEPRADPDKPNLIVFDNGSELWDSIKVWTEMRARRSKKGKETLRLDPDAEVDIPMNLWTDAADRWGKFVRLLKMWDGIAVVICRAKEVTKVDSQGRPVSGQTDYRIEAQKSFVGAVNAQVRIGPQHRASLVAAWKQGLDLPLQLPAEAPLAHLVFDILGAGGFGSSTVVNAQNARTKGSAKNELLDLLRNLGASDPMATATELWGSLVPKGATEVTDDQWAQLEGAARELVEA